MAGTRTPDPPLDSGLSLSQRRQRLAGAPPLTERVSKGYQLLVATTLDQSVSKGYQLLVATSLDQSVSKGLQYTLLLAGPSPSPLRRLSRESDLDQPVMLAARRLQSTSGTFVTVSAPTSPLRMLSRVSLDEQPVMLVARRLQSAAGDVVVSAPTSPLRLLDRSSQDETPGMVRGRQQRQITVDRYYSDDRVTKGLGYTVMEVLDQSIAKGYQLAVISPLQQSVSAGHQLAVISPLQQSVSKGLVYTLLVSPPAPVVPLPVYPALVTTYPWTRRAGHHSVRSHVSASGREARAAQAEWPVWEWDIVYDYLPNGTGGATESDMLTLAGFALDRRGSLLPFLLLDPSDYTVTSQLVGEGEGTTDTSYLLVRTLSSTEGGTEPIGQLTEITDVRVGGVSLSPDQYSLETLVTYDQRLVLLHPPGVGDEVRVDMTYMFVVRMGVDDMELSEILEDIWQCSAVTIQSLKQ